MYMCIRITNATPSAWREDTFFHDKVVLFMMLPLLLKVAQLEKKSSYFRSHQTSSKTNFDRFSKTIKLYKSHQTFHVI